MKVLVAGKPGTGKTSLISVLSKSSPVNNAIGGSVELEFFETQLTGDIPQADIALICVDGNTCDTLPWLIKTLKAAQNDIFYYTVFTRKDSHADQDIPTGMDFVVCAADASTCKGLVSALTQFSVKEPTEQMFLEVLGQIKGEELPAVTAEFTVKNPYYLRRLLIMFIRSKRLGHILSFMERLAFYSYDNGVAFHNGEIDLLLLDLLRYSDSVEAVRIPMMKVFQRVAQVASSNKSVRNYFSLLAPNESDHVFKTFPYFLASLSDLMAVEQFKPDTFLPLGSKSPYIEVSGLTGAQLRKGFTMTAWLMLDNDTKLKAEVFNISDSKGFSVSCRASKDGLFIQVGIESERKVDIKAVYNKWFFLGVSFGNNGCTVVVNDKVAPLLEYAVPNFDRESVTVKFGGIKSGSGRRRWAALGPTAVYPELTSGQMIDLGQQGSRKMPSCSASAFIYVETDFKNGILSMATKAAKLVGPSVSTYLSFAQTLVDGVKTAALLPLFSILDSSYPDGEEIPSYINMMLGILMSALNLKEDSQREFYYLDGVNILCHLLSNLEDRHLTYGVYQKFVSMFELVTYVPLKEKIFDKILLGCDLWVHAEPHAQTQIARHWCRVLYQEYGTLWRKYRSFQQILDIMRMYYWYTPVEAKIIYRDRNKDMAVSDIRQNLLQVLHAMSLGEFTTEDFSCLMAHCVSCTDPQQCVDLLSFLKLLAVSPESPLQEVSEAWYMFGTLHHLIANDNEQVVFAVIDLYAALHFLGFVEEPKVHHHVDILMDMIPASAFTPTFFNNLLPLAMKYPEFMPFCFYVILQQDSVDERMITAFLKPNSKFSGPKMWSLIPILTGFKVGGPFLQFVMDFVARSTKENWENILAEIIIIGRVINAPNATAFAVNIFLNAVCQQILANPELAVFELLHSFFDCAIFHIFYKEAGTTNDALMTTWLESEFNDTAEIGLPEDNMDPHMTKSSFYEDLKGYSGDTLSYNYGIHLDKDGNWMDYDLAMNMIKLAKKTKCQTFHNVSALLLGLAMHENPSMTREHIVSLMAMGVADPPYMEYLNLLLENGNKAQWSVACFETFTRDQQPVMDRIVNEIQESTRKILHFKEKSWMQKSNIFEMGDDNLCASSNKTMQAACTIWNTQRNETKKNWRRYLTNFTSKHGPWECVRMPLDDSHVTRSSTMCQYGCPSKWKVTEKVVSEEALPSPKRTLHERSRTLPLKANKFDSLSDLMSTSLFEVSGEMAPEKNNKFVNIETIKLDIPALYVTCDTSRQCRFLVMKSSLILSFDEKMQKVFSTSLIDRLYLKPVLHHPVAIEIVTVKRKIYLVQFPSHSALSVLKLIASLPDFKKIMIQTQPAARYFASLKVAESWVNHELGNFEYISLLNSFAGRSFDVPEAYPVFPWLIEKFNDDELDYQDEEIYRDLSKPLGGENIAYSSKKSVCFLLKNKRPFSDVKVSKATGEFDSIEKIHTVFPASELTPEFFSVPEFFTNVALPKWAKDSQYQYVYEHRKALESQFVTERLNEWIDLIFGDKQKEGKYDERMYEDAWNESTMKNIRLRTDIEFVKENTGQIPVQLFTAPHPKKTLISKPSVLSRPANCSVPGKAPVYTFIQRTAEKQYQLTSIDRTSMLYKVSAVIENGKVQCNVRDSSYSLKGENYTVCGSSIYAACGDGTVKRIDSNTGEVTTLQSHLGMATCIASDHNIVVSAGVDAAIRIFINHKPAGMIATLHSAINCVAVCASFSTCVCGTKDSFVLLYELRNGSLQHKIDMRKCIPKKILVTEGWGFILVYSEVKKTHAKYLDLYSVNGSLIRRVPLEFEIACWSTFTTIDGFDYVIMSDESGKVYLFEAFYCNIEEPICDVNKDIQSVCFSISTKLAFVVAADGTVFFIPYDKF